MAKSAKRLTMSWLQARVIYTNMIMMGLAMLVTLAMCGLFVYALFAGWSEQIAFGIKALAALSGATWVAYFIVHYAMDSAMKGK